MDRNRRRGSILAIAVLTTLATLALAPGVGATPPAATAGSPSRPRPTTALQIFTVRANGHDLRQLTHVDGDAAGPDWSPDGRRIAFTLNECSVAVMDADGDNLDVIASDPDLCQGDPSYTPDGSRLVYRPLRPGARGRGDLEHEARWFRPALRHGPGGPDPNVSPDGQKISFKGDRRQPCSSPTSTAAASSRSRRRSRSPTSTTGRRTASTSSSATTRIPRPMRPSTS